MISKVLLLIPAASLAGMLVWFVMPSWEGAFIGFALGIVCFILGYLHFREKSTQNSGFTKKTGKSVSTRRSTKAK